MAALLFMTVADGIDGTADRIPGVEWAGSMNGRTGTAAAGCPFAPRGGLQVPLGARPAPVTLGQTGCVIVNLYRE